MYVIVGHYVPTDAEIEENWPGQSGKIDGDVAVALYETREEAEADLPWYPDGVIVKERG